MWISMSLELFVAQVSGISFIRKEVVLVLCLYPRCLGYRAEKIDVA